MPDLKKYNYESGRKTLALVSVLIILIIILTTSSLILLSQQFN